MDKELYSDGLEFAQHIAVRGVAWFALKGQMGKPLVLHGHRPM
jgi:hypothetical protein